MLVLLLRISCIILTILGLAVRPVIWKNGDTRNTRRHKGADPVVVSTVDPLIDLNSPHTPPDDPSLLQLVRERYLLPPSKKNNHIKSVDVRNDGQYKVVDDYFGAKRAGVFVECGAYDGLLLSNTLFLEQERGWSGLLVEPDQENFKRLRDNHRKAIISNTCLSSNPYPEKVTIQSDKYTSRIVDATDMNLKFNLRQELLPVQCFPLQTLLLAANITSVDYFSLDVEGQELEVLKTIPWSKVDIKMLSVEYKHVAEGMEVVIEYMQSQGYRVVNNNFFAGDAVFVREHLS